MYALKTETTGNLKLSAVNAVGCLKAAGDDGFKVRSDRALSNLICPDLICPISSG